MKDENEIKRDEVYKGAHSLNISKKDREAKGVFPELGLCNRCSNLRGVVAEFGAKKAHCYIHGPMIGRHRIAKCSSFWDTTYVDLESLLTSEPIFIDVKKEKIGF